ncbi:MAG: ArsR family transcriptional regulator [Chitinophagaceae bacterium]|nr:MAG: ArsR family transcriptional regulator [Chitinophagaceae bacterium]
MSEILTKRIEEKKLFQCASMLKAIAHPSRMAIVDLLGKKKELIVTDIYRLLEMEQAAVSHHLGILKSNGLLEFRKDGKNTYYSLAKIEVLQIIQCIEKCAI